MSTSKKRNRMSRMIYYVDSTLYDESEKAYRVSIVVEGEDGHRPTGDDDHASNPRAVRPYFWGPTLKDAQQQMRKQNERLGISTEEAEEIIMQSMILSTEPSDLVLSKTKKNR